MDKKTKASVIKWRGMTHEEASVWANLRLDKIEQLLGIAYTKPNLEEITNKLEDEATEKEYYPDNTKDSIPIKFFSKIWVMVISSARHIIYCACRSNQSKSQDNTTDDTKNKTSDIKAIHKGSISHSEVSR